MSWLQSFVVSALTGVLGLIVAGVVAALGVDWYRISSFEGGSGFFVVGMALLGFIVGAIVGLITARVTGDAGLARALGTASLIVATSGLAIGGVSRLLADVPPTIDGERLLLAFEFRWPASEQRSPREIAGLGHARLGATSGQQLRRFGDGVLFVDDAHQVDGHWVVPGAVEIFTSRGGRVLDVLSGDSTLAGFLIPLPGSPGTKDREWSEWMPRARDGAPALPDGYRVRYRVVTASEPARTQEVGPFTVLTSIGGFFRTANTEEQEATTRLQLHYRGAAIPALDSLVAVAVAGERPTALLVGQADGGEEGDCQLVSEGEGAPAILPVGRCTGTNLAGELLTADSTAWRESRQNPPPAGWLDRRSFAVPGLYRLPGGILDTRTRAFTASPFPQEPMPINGLPPIGLSPDEQSYVWFAQVGEEQSPVLAVTNWHEQSTYTVPIDRGRMRYAEYDRLDPAWVAHHFEWTRAANGSLRLVARAHFTPLPYRGDREIDSKGEMSSYYLKPGGTALRDAMVDAMVNELGATREPDELDGYHKVVRYEGKLIKAAYVEGGGFVSIGMDYGTVDSPLMKRLADRLDALIATGRYDEYFHIDAKEASPS